ncbi:hypothetical protein QJS10_CPB17g01078 [Acorus calamus]|uniref:Uncharacterized protein n=1 Tax=Acorus calamus TaxID=4465 RepID=A0AAV9CUK9_ACOCL|nr:hypothetical protein QJS10_CPB17g01078 [Acorus calamus]
MNRINRLNRQLVDAQAALIEEMENLLDMTEIFGGGEGVEGDAVSIGALRLGVSERPRRCSS